MGGKEIHGGRLERSFLASEYTSSSSAVHFAVADRQREEGEGNRSLIWSDP